MCIPRYAFIIRILNALVLFCSGIVFLYLGWWGIQQGHRRTFSALAGAIVLIITSIYYYRLFPLVRASCTHFIDKIIVDFFVLCLVLPGAGAVLYMVHWNHERDMAYAAYLAADKADKTLLYSKFTAVNGEMVLTSICAIVVPMYLLAVVVRLAVLVLGAKIATRIHGNTPKR